MAKVTQKHDYEVHCQVGHSQFLATYEDRMEDERRNAEDLVKQIKRHCDGWWDATVQSSTTSTCSHCGALWTEESDEYNGGCCDKDVEPQNPEREGGEK